MRHATSHNDGSQTKIWSQIFVGDTKAISATRAFTLIELLVVIAIISLLVSILLPSLSKARELAERTVCMSNMRNISAPLHMYASDYNGYFPLRRPGAEWASGCYTLVLFTSITLPTSPQRTPSGLGWLIECDYIDIGSYQIFVCSAYDKTCDWKRVKQNYVVEKWKSRNDDCGSYYEYRDGIDGDGSPSRWSSSNPYKYPYTPMTTEISPNMEIAPGIPASTREVQLCDNVTSYFNAGRHRGGYNLLFTDSSVQWYADPNDEIAQWVQPSSSYFAGIYRVTLEFFKDAR